MAFGVTQWFMSILIFLIILAVMIWASVHLGKKEKTFNVLAIVLQFPPEKRGNLFARILPNLTSQQSTIGLTFPIQDTEEPNDTKQFYHIIYALSSGSAKNMMGNTASTTFVTTILNNETATVLNNDTTTILDNDTVTIVDSSNYTITATDNNTTQDFTLYGSTDRFRTLSNHQDIREKTVKSSFSNQPTHPPFFDLKLHQLDSYRLIELSDFFHDEKNRTVNASAGFQFVPLSKKTSNATWQMTETTQLPQTA